MRETTGIPEPGYRPLVPLLNRHDPQRAWILGLAYFAACWLVAVMAGVSPFLREPLGGNPGHPVFVVLGVAGLLAAAVGYWLIWPRGTYTAGRPLHVVAATGFGVLHGASEGMLYVAIWLTLSGWITDPIVLVVVTVGAIGVFNGVWRTFVWDVWVTPPHNIVSWNARKVLLVHLPVLTLAVAHLTAFESVAVFLSIQVVALVGAAVHMRLPSPGRRGGGRSAT